MKNIIRAACTILSFDYPVIRLAVAEWKTKKPLWFCRTGKNRNMLKGKLPHSKIGVMALRYHSLYSQTRSE